MSISLRYFPGRGLMEVPRMLLAISGRFPPNDYEDGRFGVIPDSFDANLGRMPVLKVGDNDIGQSSAINFYLASEFGLMGSSNLEAAKIISIEETIKELTAAFRTLLPYGVTPTEEFFDTWFNGGANDVDGQADGEKRSQRYLTWYSGRLEKILGNNGFAVGDRLSLADVYIYVVFGDYLKPEEAAEDVPDYRRGPFGSKERMDAKLESYPKIKAIIQSVASNENIQKWLSTRGVQHF